MTLVFLGGMLGAGLRFFISERITSNKFSIWLVNITGSFILVSFFLLYNEGNISNLAFTFWGTGFSGAFTTFSTVNNQLFESIVAKNFKHVCLIITTTYLGIFLSILLFYFFITSFLYFLV